MFIVSLEIEYEYASPWLCVHVIVCFGVHLIQLSCDLKLNNMMLVSGGLKLTQCPYTHTTLPSLLLCKHIFNQYT